MACEADYEDSGKYEGIDSTDKAGQALRRLSVGMAEPHGAKHMIISFRSEELCRSSGGQVSGTSMPLLALINRSHTRRESHIPLGGQVRWQAFWLSIAVSNLVRHLMMGSRQLLTNMVNGIRRSLVDNLKVNG